jgi:hypothetical protein
MIIFSKRAGISQGCWSIDCHAVVKSDGSSLQVLLQVLFSSSLICDFVLVFNLHFISLSFSSVMAHYIVIVVSSSGTYSIKTAYDGLFLRHTSIPNMALRMDYWAPLRYKILSLLVAAG